MKLCETCQQWLPVDSFIVHDHAMRTDTEFDECFDCRATIDDTEEKMLTAKFKERIDAKIATIKRHGR